jgi:L-asparaginase
MDVKKDQKVVVLATGGTIAGVAEDVSKPNNYVSGQLGVNQLTQNLITHGVPLIQEQVCNIDSKDMQFSHWQALLERCHFWLNQNDVAGLILTHGTDTLEETAFFLQVVLQPTKPVAMTCAMFPANVPQSDGPKNLQDALDWVLKNQDNGVHLVCGGEVHFGIGAQKIFSDRAKAFASHSDKALGEHLPIPQIDWPFPTVEKVLKTQHWPRVELIYNHAGADGQLVRNLLQGNELAKSGSYPHSNSNASAITSATASTSANQTSRVAGIVVAGTGSGTLSHGLERALMEAQKAGLWVARTSRCAYGVSDPVKHPNIPSLHNLSPMQGRVAMMLGLLARS